LSSYSPRNAERILGYLETGVLSRELIPPHINFSHLSSEDYSEMYSVIKTVQEEGFPQLGLEACLLEDELNKVSRAPGDSGQVHGLNSSAVFYHFPTVLQPRCVWISGGTRLKKLI